MSALLALLGGLRKLAGWCLDLVRSEPWPCACGMLLGLSIVQWSGKHRALDQRDAARELLADEKAGREADGAEWDRSVAAAKAATAAAVAKSKEIASHAQTTHDALAADAAGLRRYIAAHRVRGEAGAAVAARPADDLGAAVPADTAAGPFVAASEADIFACDAAYVYAASAHEWAMELIAAELAKPAATQ